MVDRDVLAPDLRNRLLKGKISMKTVKLSMLKQRIVTALALVLLFVVTLFAVPPTVISLLAMAPLIVAGWEWCKLAEIKNKSSAFGFLLALVAVLLVTYHLLDVNGDFDRHLSFQICLYSLVLWGFILLWIQGYPSSGILWGRTSIILVLGLIILTTTWIAFTAIVVYDNGRWLLLLAVLIVALADVGGYFAGNFLGRHKLAVLVSPGKTWEGFTGGMALQGILIAALKIIFPDLSIIDLIILIVPVALSSVVGDLFESMLKRHSGVKDSSSLLPGHGGVLDRIDGVMAALPMFWVLLIQSKVF